jgi:quercetin dioxygenase-like cupin family protein
MTTSNADPAIERQGGDMVLELAAGLAAYQDGAIVIREVVKKRTGTVTIFALDKGLGLKKHSRRFDTLIQMLDGVADITIGGTSHRLGKNETIVMPARSPCTLKAVKRFKMISVMMTSKTADG